MKQVHGRDPFDDFNLLSRRLAGLESHALIISLAAFADDCLRRLIRTFLRPHSSTDSLIDGFNAPLGSFSAKIKMAHAFGLISEDQFADLEILRKIRNTFSHTWHEVGLENENIAKQINNLNYSSIDDEFPSTPEERIRLSISALIVEMESTTNQILQKGQGLGLIGGRLAKMAAGNSASDQMANINKSIDEVRQKINSTSGEERRFYIKILKRWAFRIGMVYVSLPNEEARILKQQRDAIDLEAQRWLLDDNKTDKL